MGIDFSSLVLAPAMATFANPVLVTPLASQPNAAPYSARGIWSVQETTIIGEASNTFSTVNITFGIRWAEYPATAPSQGDWISTPAKRLPLGYWQGQIDPEAVIDFVIDDVTPDGQGGAKLWLKRVIT
jgi:hypothetical protein